MIVPDRPLTGALAGEEVGRHPDRAVAAHREQLAVADHLVHPRHRDGEHLRDLGHREHRDVVGQHGGSLASSFTARLLTPRGRRPTHPSAGCPWFACEVAHGGHHATAPGCTGQHPDGRYRRRMDERPGAESRRSAGPARRAAARRPLPAGPGAGPRWDVHGLPGHGHPAGPARRGQGDGPAAGRRPGVPGPVRARGTVGGPDRPSGRRRRARPGHRRARRRRAGRVPRHGARRGRHAARRPARAGRAAGAGGGGRARPGARRPGAGARGAGSCTATSSPRTC